MKTETLFNLEHNLTEYNNLVLDKYPDEIAEVSEPMAVETASMFAQPCIAVELEEYASPCASSGSTTQETFRPKIFDTDITEIDFKTPGLPRKQQFSKIENIIDIAPHLATEQPEVATVAETEVKAEVETETNFETRFKLNAVGMVAVVSFIAVTLLVISFIIANSVSISNVGARINQLRTDNTAIHQQIQNQQQRNNTAQSNQQDVARDMANNYQENGLIQVPPQQMPPSLDGGQNFATWTPASSITTSGTGFFDWLSRILSRIFVG